LGGLVIVCFFPVKVGAAGEDCGGGVKAVRVDPFAFDCDGDGFATDGAVNVHELREVFPVGV
jgi:hypothetical protein